MNKKGLEFKSSFFAIIVFSVIIIAYGTIIADWNSAYNSGLTNDLGDLNRLSEVSVIANSSRSSLEIDDPQPGQDAESSTFSGVYSVITRSFSSLLIVYGEDGMLRSIADKFGIPDYIQIAIISMMVIAITYALVAIVFRLGGGKA